MLVLSRKPGEKIVIGENITITVLEVQGDRVRIGFAAPVEIPIQRQEIHLSKEDRLPPFSHAGCV